MSDSLQPVQKQRRLRFADRDFEIRLEMGIEVNDQFSIQLFRHFLNQFFMDDSRSVYTEKLLTKDLFQFIQGLVQDVSFVLQRLQVTDLIRNVHHSNVGTIHRNNSVPVMHQQVLLVFRLEQRVVN